MTQEQHKGKMSLTQLEITKRRTKSLSGVARLPSGEVLEGGADPHKLRSRLLSRYIYRIAGNLWWCKLVQIFGQKTHLNIFKQLRIIDVEFKISMICSSIQMNENVHHTKITQYTV